MFTIILQPANVSLSTFYLKSFSHKEFSLRVFHYFPSLSLANFSKSESSTRPFSHRDFFNLWLFNANFYDSFFLIANFSSCKWFSSQFLTTQLSLIPKFYLANFSYLKFFFPRLFNARCFYPVNVSHRKFFFQQIFLISNLSFNKFFSSRICSP